jgi:hypothetical protein
MVYKIPIKAKAMFRRKSGELEISINAEREHGHELTPILPETPTPSPGNYSLADLKESINRLCNEAKHQEHLQRFANQLLALLEYLHERHSQQLKTGIKDENAQTFLNETVVLLHHLERIKSNFQDNVEFLIGANQPTGLATLVETTLVAQTVAMLDYEKSCKDAARLSGYGWKIFTCVIITGVFAILGGIAGIGVGLFATGGIPTPFALASLTHGSITGAAIGAAIGGWLLGLPSFALSQHILFKPAGLTKHLNDLVTEGQKAFVEEERLHKDFLVA